MRQDVLDKARDDPRGTAARILDAAEVEFAEHGFPGASTREIARRARVPFGALHYHWGSKQQLREAVYTRLADRLQETFVRNFVPGTTPGEILDNLTDAYFELLVANRSAVRLACRTFLEVRDPHIERLFSRQTEWGVRSFQDLAPGTTIDVMAVILLLSSAFVGVITNEAGQETNLGGSIFKSRAARERVRAQLRRMSRAMFQIVE